MLEKTAEDFSKFLQLDMENKLGPINKSIDCISARLEEYQTMICFAKQERAAATGALNSVRQSNRELLGLFARINAMESLVARVRDTLVSLEADLDKAEEDLGYTDSATTKVANMLFTPLFKKTPEKKPVQESATERYKTSDYFD